MLETGETAKFGGAETQEGSARFRRAAQHQILRIGPFRQGVGVEAL
jgi:hypothetical protein